MWAAVVAWVVSEDGSRLIAGVVAPVLAAVIATLIALRALGSAARRQDRAAAAEAVGSAVAAASAVAAGRAAPRLRAESDARLRLLPLPGAARAADWVAATLDAPASPPEDLRDRLLAWIAHPKRARALFAAPPPIRDAPRSAPSAETMTAPVAVPRDPDPALLAEPAARPPDHARHAGASSAAGPAERSRAPHHPPAHRDRPVWLDSDDDAAATTAEAGAEAPAPVPVAALGNRRGDSESLVPDGAVPVTRVGHRAPR